MNLIRIAFLTPKRLFLLPRCTIVTQQLSTTVNYTSKYRDSVISSWRDLFKNPTDWCDYREDKSIGLVKAKFPDFKHKSSRAGLWLHSAPNWVLAGLDGLNVGKKEDSWKNLVRNPHKWWDNRPIKINLKAPDFKHKETGESLWLDSAPKWVLAGREGLHLGKSKKEDSWKDLIENPHEWWDNRTRKSNVNSPDFIRKATNEALWLESSPKWVLALLEGLTVGKGKKEDSWKNLVENPDKWWDNRTTKTHVNAPDFIHKEINDALWLDGSPKWILTVLEGLNVEAGGKEDSWMNLVENPDKWWDNRTRKTNVNWPDFKHKETGEPLWLDRSPKWVLAMLEGVNLGNGTKEDSWKNLG